MKIKILVLLSILTGIIISGCVNNDMSSVVNTLPEVQQYLKEHPEAKITVTHMSKEEIEKISQDINYQCGKTITPTDMYKVIIIDKDLKIVSWVDTKSNNLICSSTGGTDSSNPNPVQTITVHTPTDTVTKTPTTTQTTISPIPTVVQTTSNPTEYINVEYGEQTLTKIRNKGYTTEVKYEYPDSGKIYLIVTFDLTNNGYQEFKTDFTDWKLSVSTEDNPNTYVKIDVDIPTLHSLDHEYPQAMLQNGGKLKGQLAYQVPDNWKDYKLTYGPSYKGIKFKFRHIGGIQTSDPTVTDTQTSTYTSPQTPTYTSPQTPTIPTSCDPSYPDFCIPPPPPDLNCKDIPHKNFKVLQPDPHRFDRDKDGIGCET